MTGRHTGGQLPLRGERGAVREGPADLGARSAVMTGERTRVAPGPPTDGSQRQDRLRGEEGVDSRARPAAVTGAPMRVAPGPPTDGMREQDLRRGERAAVHEERVQLDGAELTTASRRTAADLGAP